MLSYFVIDIVCHFLCNSNLIPIHKLRYQWNTMFWAMRVNAKNAYSPHCAQWVLPFQCWGNQQFPVCLHRVVFVTGPISSLLLICSKSVSYIKLSVFCKINQVEDLIRTAARLLYGEAWYSDICFTAEFWLSGKLYTVFIKMWYYHWIKWMEWDYTGQSECLI